MTCLVRHEIEDYSMGGLECPDPGLCQDNHLSGASKSPQPCIFARELDVRTNTNIQKNVNCEPLQ